MRGYGLTGVVALAIMAAPAAAQTTAAPVEEVSVDQLQQLMQSGATSSVAITQAYLARIAAIDRQGPTLRSVIATNPDALAQAKALDDERRAGRVRGPLHGVPVLIKDNIETADAMATTAGSLALKDNVTRRDAPVVAYLRRAGAVILGKTNLSEWANIRSTRSMSGWSAVGGLVRNPYALDRTACGSSSGSGAAIAASLAAVAVGTETDGSVVCPSSINGLVGFKPTLGLVSRSRVVPISHSQDTPGPMGRSVRDVALLLSAMASPDPTDAATARTVVRDYAAGLSAGALKSKRVGVIRPAGLPTALAERFDAALKVLRAAGATLVEVTPPKLDGLGEAELLVLKTELKADLDAYLATTPSAVRARTLAQVVAFNRANVAAEMPFFGQELFEAAMESKGLADPAYRTARATSLRLAGREGIDAMLKTARADLLVEPTYAAAWLSDPVYGDQYGGPSASELPAVAGYPHLTVPMGLMQGLPVGLSFIGTAGADAAILSAGYAYEQRSKARVAPRYLPQAAVAPGLEGAGR
ncbi:MULTISPECIES: amidase [unclassified Sphingomonas]|uniref:amidase n=1 Tax=unclassified Sphingomonas TaxID=196159 RepID=UPI0006FFB350|nr:MULTISPECIES: amidase [unclassified Sphingomonas]KQM24548.1 amidase [Sphingomonas sp. Leaf9]KQM42207.1 amidase [Sphingomonas sp. Leaf11]